MAPLAVVVNARAGRASAAMLAALRAASPVVIVTARVEDADAALAELVGRGTARLVLAGGDGTIVRGLAALAAASAAAGRPPPVVGVLALGSGNALARAIGARPRRPRAIAAALAAAATAPPVTVPMLAVEGLRAPFCGFGLDAQLVADADAVAAALARRGLPALPAAVRYAVALPWRSVPRFLRTPPPRVTVHDRGGDATMMGAAGELGPARTAPLWTGACTLVACATIPYFGFGLRMFAFAGARPDRFQVRAGDPGLGEVLRSTPAAFRGRYFSPRVRDFLCRQVTLEADRPAPFEIAGDVVGLRTRVDVALGAPAHLVAV